MIAGIYENLAKHGHMDRIYEALQHDDYSKAVMAALDVLTNTGQMPKFDKEKKCETKSTMYRKQGNEDYVNNNYPEALICYNKAILFAPQKSTALTLGYSNRSALLYHTKAYKACLNDIDTCYKLGLTDQFVRDKLERRVKECTPNLWADIGHEMNKVTFGGTFFNFNVPRNHQVPCASLDVGVVKETDKFKVVAVKNIDVGTLVSLETAYACELRPEVNYLACYYCHKLDLNLIPCDNCCDAMFCSETCKVLCNREFHNTECQIMHCFKFFELQFGYKMIVKSVIKMRQMCSSWAEFIEASKKIGAKRISKSSVNEIYDVNNKFSILCNDHDIHFFYGQLCNISFKTSFLIFYLLGVKSFFPENHEVRDEAIKAIARVLVDLNFSCINVTIIHSSRNLDTKTITTNSTTNIGWFSFTGKLKHSCDPNLLVIGLNNKVALIAIKPIKKNDELTISYS